MFVRSTGDQVYLRRSLNDGASWAGYTAAGVTLDQRPLRHVVGPGRVDLRHPRASGAVVQSWYRGGKRLGSTQLGGTMVAQHAVSLGDGTLDVFAVAPDGVAVRQHWDRIAVERLAVRRREVHLRAVGLGQPGHPAGSS